MTPFPARAWVRRTLSLLVWQTWAWCMSRSTVAVARLRDIQSITDAALSSLDDQKLLTELLERTRATLQADTAAVLLLDYRSGHLIAVAAAGLEEEVPQGVRIPVGRGFAGRIAAEHGPVILDRVDHETVLNPILLAKGIRGLMGVPLIAGGSTTHHTTQAPARLRLSRSS